MAISLWQPWASAIVLKFKRYETRGWSTSYRGPLLIHAAKRWTKEEVRFQWGAVRTLRLVFGAKDPRVLAFEQNPPLGAVIGIADLVDCHQAVTIREKLPLDSFNDDGDAENGIERMFGNFSPGRFAWELANVTSFPEPIPCNGRQGLFALPDDVVNLVNVDPLPYILPGRS